MMRDASIKFAEPPQDDADIGIDGLNTKDLLNQERLEIKKEIVGNHYKSVKNSIKSKIKLNAVTPVKKPTPKEEPSSP